METLLAPLREMEEYTQLRLAVDKGETPVTVVGGMEAQKCHMIYLRLLQFRLLQSVRLRMT